MRVLFVCHRVPFPPARGGKIRPFNIIRHLHDQGHEVTVASLARDQAELDESAGLAEHCARCLIEIIPSPVAMFRMLARAPSMTPSSMGYFYSPALARRIDAALKESHFDLIIVHCSSVAPYVAHVRGVPKLFDLGDIDSEKWLLYARKRRMPAAAIYWIEGTKLQRAEKKLARQFDFCTCTTRAELETLDSFGIGVPTGWFPNGVDTEYFSVATKAYNPKLIAFIGRMDYYPNQEAMLRFCRDIFPLVRELRPDARLQIVGANPSPRIVALAKLDGVTVTGSVPDVRPYIHAAALTVAPLAIARGTQNKIIESMAMGVPVVTSPEAAGGVDAVPGEHLIVADGPEEFARATLNMLNDAGQRAALSAAGRARVLSNHNWSASMGQFEQLVDACVSAARRGRVA